MNRRYSNFVVGLLVMSLSLSAHAEPDLSLICPCSVEAIGETGVAIVAGARNSGSSSSGPLRLTLESYEKLDGNSRYRAIAYLPASLAPGFQYRQGSMFESGLNVIGEKRSYAIRLEEAVGNNWISHDLVRLDPPLQLEETGGESVLADLYFDGAPSIEIVGGEVVVHIPRIVNTSKSDAKLTGLRVGHFKSEAFWGQNFSYGSAIEIDLLVPASSFVNNIEFTGDYIQPDEDKPYTHLSLRDEIGVRIWQTIESRENELTPREMKLSSIDFLEDTDGDGVTDYNERLTESDPLDLNSKLEDVTLDVLFVYTPGVSDVYLDDPVTKFIQEIEWGNQALKNSRVNAKFRYVGSEEWDYPDRTDSSDALNDATNSETISALRTRYKADFVVLYIEEDSRGFCGVAWNNGTGLEGDLGFESKKWFTSVVTAGCRSNTLTHELGHNLGLGHSVRQESDEGAFKWSRGHGVTLFFSTIMAYGREYLYFGPDLQIFSNPKLSCFGFPCGVEEGERLQANAALSIQTTMFQAAGLEGVIPVADVDNDGVSDIKDNCRYLENGNQIDTDRDDAGDTCDVDDDNDGLTDSQELELGTNPKLSDSDGDGLGDAMEIELGTNPIEEDTDEDGWDDYLEVSVGSDPNQENCPSALCKGGSWIYGTFKKEN